MTILLAGILAALSGGQGSDDYLRSEERKVERWKKALEKNPDDREACLQVGRFLCFVRGSWDEGLPILARGKDEAASEAARMEVSQDAIAQAKNSPLTGATFEVGAEAAPDVVRGDAWWDLSRKLKEPELFSVLGRAIHWYEMGMSKVDEQHRRKLQDRVDRVRDRCRALSVRPQGRAIEACPKGWGVVLGKGEKMEGVATDDSRSHGGRVSLRVRFSDHGMLVSERKVVQPSAEFTLSFWYMTEGAQASDLVSVWFIGRDDRTVLAIPTKVDQDKSQLLVWRRAEVKVKSPADAAFFRVYVNQPAVSAGGTLWLDDVSLKASGSDAELLQNPSFEER